MIDLYDPYQERLYGRNLLVSEEADVPSGERKSVMLNGRRNRRYGVLAATIDTTQPDQRVSFFLQDGDVTLFENVLTGAVSQLFEVRTYDLAAPLEIPDGSELIVTFANPTASASSNSVLIQGLPYEQLSQREDSIRAGAGQGTVPRVNFGYKSIFVEAGGIVRRTLELPKARTDWVTDHIEIASTSDDVRVSVDETETTVIPLVSVGAFIELSQHRVATESAFRIGDRDNVGVTVQNPTSEAQTVSVLMPLYETSGSLTQIKTLK